MCKGCALVFFGGGRLACLLSRKGWGSGGHDRDWGRFMPGRCLESLATLKHRRLFVGQLGGAGVNPTE